MSLKDGRHEPCSDKCMGCEHNHTEGHTTHFYTCTRYLQPESMWRSGVCPSATHMRKQQTPEQKKRAGQQHQVKGKQLSKKQQESYKRLG